VHCSVGHGKVHARTPAATSIAVMIGTLNAVNDRHGADVDTTTPIMGAMIRTCG